MIAKLVKHDSPIAREARLRLITKSRPRPASSPEGPSEEQIEIAALKAELAHLIAERKATSDKWDAELSAAHTMAKEEAAREHVTNDRRRANALDAALANAQQKFEGAIAGQIAPLAAQVAAHAFAKLVMLRQGDEDWLARVVDRRLKDIRAASVFALHLAPEDAGSALTAALRESGRQSVPVNPDSTLKPGTAKIVLKLGEIDICPADGAGEVFQCLAEAGGGHE
jgi:flagellar biosynthesis/type III secretory pathway protein FliH